MHIIVFDEYAELRSGCGIMTSFSLKTHVPGWTLKHQLLHVNSVTCAATQYVARVNTKACATSKSHHVILCI